MHASHLAENIAAALPYDRYVQTGTEQQQKHWRQVYDAIGLTDAQKQLVAGFARDMKILVISGVWCGDCVQQCPMLARIAEANPARIDLRFVDRDQHRELADKVRINGGDRVPAALLIAEDHELCAVYGDRTLTRYRSLASKQLGPVCPTGILLPDRDEMAGTLQDWLDEVERVQLMLRLSARLRQKHGD